MTQNKTQSPRPQRIRKSELAERIVAFLNKENKQAFNYKQIGFAIDASAASQRMDLIHVLDDLASTGAITEVSLGRYKANSNRGNENIGTFMRRANGKNAVILDDEQIMVAERNSMHALNGDKVRVVVSAARRGQDPEAKVVEIVEEKDQVFIGTLKVDGNYAAVVTDSKYLAADIIIPRSKLKGGKDGDKAVARITRWEDDEMNPRGEIVDILGKKGENTAEMHAILAEFGLPYRYPTNVEKAADTIEAGITPEEISKREDFRGVTTFTIDPKDAKDFDDALSIRRLANGNVEVGVHIADVTHYVTPGSIIDKEAQSRATSVYLVDRTIPMLPEHLSNGICSLRPNEEKLTFSAIFELDRDANIIHSRIGRTVIKSDRRFTYEEAQEIIEGNPGDYAKELRALDALAKKLRTRRFEEGAVEFDRAEVRFDIDKDGKPVGVILKESKDSNKLVEEFMLLANKAVAEYIGQGAKKEPGKRKTKAKTFVYRVHDAPDAEKLASLALMAQRFGYKVKTEGSPRVVNRSINKLLKAIKGKPEEHFLAMLALRSMARAEYTSDNIGHYGLGFDNYTHFTSPIRRYPDMMVHRLLERYLSKGRSVDVKKIQELCEHSSEREQLATNAERASVRYKQVEYMQDRIGEIYTGTITGVTEWGLYVELDDNMCEGLVPMRELLDDFYDYDEKNYCLTGRRHKSKYTLGDRVKVQVARADLDRKQLDFIMLGENGRPLRKPKTEDQHTASQHHKTTKQRKRSGSKQERKRSKK